MNKVLLVSSLKSGNSLIDNLYLRLKQYINIEIGIDNFWKRNRNINYKIIHLQWPEELFGWRNIEEGDLKRLIKQMFFWKKKGTKFVITRHNILPHKLGGIYSLVYNEIYKNCDVVIHFSNESVKDFKKRYSFNHIEHYVIYHPMYDNIENNISQEEARKILGISKEKKVILVFGAIRHEKEQRFIIETFEKLNLKDKFLVVPRFYQVKPSKFHVLKRCKFEIEKFLKKIQNDKYILGNEFISEKEIQLYMNASDIVFLPRFEVLNSGVLSLAYSFNKVVVGPSVGSIGEVLSLSNNPVFEVGNIDEAVAAIKRGILISKDVENLLFAQKYMNWNIAIEKHLFIYKRLLNVK